MLVTMLVVILEKNKLLFLNFTKKLLAMVKVAQIIFNLLKIKLMLTLLLVFDLCAGQVMEWKSRKNLDLWYMIRKCFYEDNDDDNDDYSDDDIKVIFLHTWFLRRLWVK